MKKFASTFLFILLCKNILIANSGQTIKKEEKFIEIQKCIFLEKQLIPSPKNLTMTKKIFKTVYPIVISVVIAHVIYKILGFVKTKISRQKTNKEAPGLISYLQEMKKNFDVLRQLSQNPSKASLAEAMAPREIKFPSNLNTQSQTKPKNNYNISSVFVIATPIYLLIKFLTREKEFTQLQILTNFIKDWPSNKINIPQKFHQRFDYLYQIYKNEESLTLSELDAERIIRTTIMETIDYKIKLQSNHVY